MSGMRVAVTGGSGRVGTYVVKHLVERGYDVVNLDQRAPKQRLAKWTYVDLRYRHEVQSVMEHVDAVCHLGEIPHPGAPFAPEEIYWRNSMAGSVVLQSAADMGLKRVVYVSTCQVYGSWGDPFVPPKYFPIDESHPYQPQNVYALSKIGNENYANFVGKHHKLSVAVFRFPWVISWPISDDELCDWLDRPMREIDGFCTYVHAKDAARACALALENPRPGCETYNIAGTEIFSGMPLKQMLDERFPGHPPIPDDWPAFKSPLLSAKAFEHFGWRAEWNVLEIYRKKHGCEPKYIPPKKHA
jgi:nucleoside-diphosphate-sugar epimerase